MSSAQFRRDPGEAFGLHARVLVLGEGRRGAAQELTPRDEGRAREGVRTIAVQHALRPHAIVSEVIYDDVKGKAVGVRVIDALSKKTEEFFARVIFLTASTLGSTFILLNSVSRRFPTTAVRYRRAAKCRCPRT